MSTQDLAATLAKAEEQVARDPRNGAKRAALAQAYLGAGRFSSAATAFEDARSLGDSSPMIALGATLAYIGSGRQDDALATLAQWGQTMPAGDYGLALALAGRPEQAVTVLTNALRDGQATPKLRQNLAYAYALSGNWSAAQVIAAQDVPADQLHARLGEWARESLPQDYQARVATLLGAPLRGDPGQPLRLALNPAQSAARMAAATENPDGLVNSSREGVKPAVQASSVVNMGEELPPVQNDESGFDQSQPSASPAPVPVPQRMAAKMSAIRQNVVYKQDVSDSRLGHASASRPIKAPHKPAAQAAEATHLVQLGSFRTLEGAQRAWLVFVQRNPGLKGHRSRITQAKVNGRSFYRVAAVGFDSAAAQAMCSRVKGRGAECLAYAQKHPLPGRVSTVSTPRLAANDMHEP